MAKDGGASGIRHNAFRNQRRNFGARRHTPSPQARSLMFVTLYKFWLALVGTFHAIIGAARGSASATLRSVRDSGGRRRLLILLAAALVCSFAIGVFSHVMSMPDLGLRFGFGCVVNRIYNGYVDAAEGEGSPDLTGKKIVSIGTHPVSNLP